MLIVKVPGINGLKKTNGCEKAGNKILKTLYEIYSNEQKKPINIKEHELEEIHLDNSNLELTHNLIYKNSLEIYETNPKTIFLGGDHSITYPLTKSFLQHTKNSNKEPCLIIFDAHADCMKPLKEPTHEEWLRKLIEEGFPTKNILLVGTRNLWKDETEFLKKHKIRTISINQFTEDLNDTCDIIMEFTKNKETYLSIDIDVIDPAFAPATGHPEPAGLTSREFIFIIQRINKIKTLKAIDIVEINPTKDPNNLTTKLGAKILSELI